MLGDALKLAGGIHNQTQDEPWATQEYQIYLRRTNTIDSDWARK
jgi:hypothetical protein